MKFSQKCMFLGIRNFTKNDKTFYLLKILDKNTNEPHEFFIYKPEKLREVKLYSDIELNFELSKRFDKETKTYYWNLSLVEE